jgi:hypothetical protein
MKHLAITILILIVSVITMYGQINRPTSMILRYQKVTEFIFDGKTQDYKVVDTIEFSGAISVDPTKVFIKGYNNKSDKTLNIISFENEEGTNRDIYTCKMNGEQYSVAISPDKKYLTQIGFNEKFIYELKTNYDKSDHFQMITINKESSTKEIFIAQSLEVKPIFGDSNTFEEGEKRLKEYLSTEINKQEKLKSGICYISIVINKEGKVEDVKLLYGKDNEFNKVALEVVKEMPNWKPGKQKSKPVNASYSLEVKK